METDVENRIKQLIADELVIPADNVSLHDIGGEYIISAETQTVATSPSRVHPYKHLIEKISSQFGITVRVIRHAAEIESQIEQWIKIVVAKIFPSLPEKVIATTTTDGKINIWIIPTQLDHDIPVEVRSKINTTCSQVLRLSGYELADCRIVGYENDQPTLLVILRYVKINQPITLPLLKAALENDKYRVPNDKWLQVQLDHLRDRDFLCFAAAPGEAPVVQYALTLNGLNALPAQVGRQSSDVLRALVLGSRSW